MVHFRMGKSGDWTRPSGGFLNSGLGKEGGRWLPWSFTETAFPSASCPQVTQLRWAVVEESLPSMQRPKFDFPSQKTKHKVFWEAEWCGFGTQHLQPERSGLDPLSVGKNNVTWRSYLTSLESFLMSKMGLILICRVF